jgi:hypothetical protein
VGIGGFAICGLDPRIHLSNDGREIDGLATNKKQGE